MKADSRHLLIVGLMVAAFLACENAKDPVAPLGKAQSMNPPVTPTPPCGPDSGFDCPYPVPNCPDCPCLAPGSPGVANVPYCTPTPTPTPTATPTATPITPGPGIG